MKHYSQRTLEQRYIINTMLKIKYSQTEIAKVIGVHKSTITDSEIIHAMKMLNNRPRKRLGFNTPNEVFFGESYTVALTT